MFDNIIKSVHGAVLYDWRMGSGQDEARLILIQTHNLMTSLSNSKILSLFKHRIAPRTPSAFVLASIVSGFTWYFTNQQSKDFSAHQQELIGRVERGESGENFKTEFDRLRVGEWDCKKVNIDGVIKDGRFFVKRSRGKQEGYLVLAPFVIQTSNSEPNVRSPEAYESANQHRKFIINLGWIPRSRKHLVYATIPENILGEETYADREEALRKQEADGLIRDPLSPQLSVPISNVTAYVRKAEAEDRLNGRTNFKENDLFKWINLQELTRVFRVFNEQEGETIYLERTTKSDDEPEVIPIPASKETLIADLNTESSNFQKNSSRYWWLTTGASFAVASWITFL